MFRFQPLALVPWSACGLLLLANFSLNSASHQSANIVSPTQQRQKLSELQSLSRKLKPLHQKMLPVQPGDWLESHPEKNQSFLQYVRSQPIVLTPTRNVLYVLPMGEFDQQQRKIVELSAEFLGLYFGCTVKTLETIALDDVIPASARRIHPTWDVRQIKSTYVLETVLPPRLPADGFALISFTTSDLYPDDDWNFVFGQAMLRDRVGVWSLFRNGDPHTEFKLVLKRTLRIATHETGHMFSVPHCTAYECNMCGSNSLAESDRRPLYLCPQCVAKIGWATGCDLSARFRKLREFCQQHQLADEVDYYSQALEAIQERSN